MKENENNLILINERICQTTVYQFLIDKKGKKYIKMFSADKYWTEGEHKIFVAEFTEDNLPKQLKKNWDEFQEEFIFYIKSRFNDEEMWKSNRK